MVDIISRAARGLHLHLHAVEQISLRKCLKTKSSCRLPSSNYQTLAHAYAGRRVICCPCGGDRTEMPKRINVWLSLHSKQSQHKTLLRLHACEERTHESNQASCNMCSILSLLFRYSDIKPLATR